MKFRTKLFYSFIALGLMSTLLALFIIYGEASRLIFEEIQSKILSLVINSERIIDPKVVSEYEATKGNTDSLEFRALEKELIEIRDINRRSDIFVEYVYLIKQYHNSDHYYYLIDIQTGDINRSIDYGQRYLSGREIPENLSQPYVTKHIYADEWGTWISGYIPIYDDKGNQVCILGMDIRTQEIYLELEKLLIYELGAFVISIFVAVIFAYFLSKLVSSSLSVLCDTVKGIGKGDFSSRSPLLTQDEFNELSIAINQMAQGLEERERLKVGFTRYVSQYALEELLKLDQPITLDGERKKVTVLFTDLRNFTKLSEHLPPEEVLKLLNEYYEEMIEVIFKYGGTLDKFIGDGMMVEFGAPLEDNLQELHAVLAAIHMQLHLEKLSDKWESEGKRRMLMGVGIHTGLAVIGNIGSEKRMEYTAIGDTVNVAARLEQATKKIDRHIIVSKTVYDKVKDHFIFEDLKEVAIPGRKGIIQSYALDPFNQKDLSHLEEIEDPNSSDQK